MRLFQIPFSHNCVKVRHVLQLKDIPHETADINPLWRPDVFRASRQFLVPALIDDGRAISGSTEILLYIEDRYPQPALLPSDPAERAECIVLMDWADAAFMALTRRMAYHQVLSGPRSALGALFFPRAPEPVQRAGGVMAAFALRTRFRISEKNNRMDVDDARRVAATAVARIDGADHLVGETLTLADITLATMAAPLQYAATEVTQDESIQRLLAWSEAILGGEYTQVPDAQRQMTPAH
jgi:glutathione S-transferase